MRTHACAVLAAALAALALPAARAQLELPRPRAIIGARVPALSPDGKRLAFVYRGDVWIADSSGGAATALTRNVETDSYPQFSPDGNWVAFASTRNGNWDLYVVPAVGGTPRRLTWHSGTDISYGWSPDGRSLLFTSRRETGDVELLSLDVRSLRVRKLAQDYNDIAYANWSPDARTIVFGTKGFPWTRPRYHGSAAMQVVLLDTVTGKRRQITDDGRQHLWPRFLPDGRSLLTVTVGEVTPSAPRLNEKPAKFVDSPTRGLQIEIHDPVRALELIGKDQGRFTERVDITSGGQPLKGYVTVSPDDWDDDGDDAQPN